MGVLNVVQKMKDPFKKKSSNDGSSMKDVSFRRTGSISSKTGNIKTKRTRDSTEYNPGPLWARPQSKHGHRTSTRRQSRTSEYVHDDEQVVQTPVEDELPKEQLKEDVNTGVTEHLTDEEDIKVKLLQEQVLSLLQQVHELQTQPKDQKENQSPFPSLSTTTITPSEDMSSKLIMELNAATKEIQELRQKLDENHALLGRMGLPEASSTSTSTGKTGDSTSTGKTGDSASTGKTGDSTSTGQTGDAAKENAELRKQLEEVETRLQQTQESMMQKESTGAANERDECTPQDAAKDFTDFIDQTMEWVETFIWTEDVEADATLVTTRAFLPGYEASVEAFKALCDLYPEYRIHSRYRNKEDTAIQGLVIRLIHSKIFGFPLGTLGGVLPKAEEELRGVTTSLENNSEPRMSEYDCRLWHATGLHGIKQHPEYEKTLDKRVATILDEVLLPMTVFIDPTRLDDARRNLRQNVIIPAMNLQGRIACTTSSAFDTGYIDFIEGEDQQYKKDYKRQSGTTTDQFFEYAGGFQLRNVDNSNVDISKASVPNIKKLLKKHCVFAPGLTSWVPQGYKGAKVASTPTALVRMRVEVSWGHVVDEPRKSSFLDELYGMAKASANAKGPFGQERFVQGRFVQGRFGPGPFGPGPFDEEWFDEESLI